jgi:hypothetical protein
MLCESCLIPSWKVLFWILDAQSGKHIGYELQIYAPLQERLNQTYEIHNLSLAMYTSA